MILCKRCRRHVKSHETDCPFCGEQLVMDRRASVAVAASLVLGAALVGCGDDDDEGGGGYAGYTGYGGAVAAYGPAPGYGPAPYDAGDTDGGDGGAGGMAAMDAGED
jgi:hypothetical protein